VKKIFKLASLPRRHTTEVVNERLVSQVQRHALDYGSMEAKIAVMTVSIRNLQDYMDKFPRNKRAKVELKELIDKRKKFLKYLRRWDYKRFEWVLEKLDLVYKPPPAEFHWITRKESLVKLTNQHCDKIKQERLDAYRKQLESQQLEFLANKLKNLQFIRKEQVECKLPVTVSPEQIQAVKSQYEVLLSQRPDQDDPVFDERKAQARRI
jgi:small subunit ribosomal protein S15